MTLSLTHLTTVCGGGSCPTVYKTDDGRYVVQGYVTDLVGPDGQLLVEIPKNLLAEAAAVEKAAA